MALTAGARLGPYEIHSAIGAGGMGEVYKARDTRLARTVAIKVLPAHVAADPDARQRFEREARAVAALNHPHICTLHDIGSQDGTDFLVMEYLEGETLAERLSKAEGLGLKAQGGLKAQVGLKAQGGLALDEALRIGTQIADALDKAHRAGIVHRDLKPGNIMLTKSGAKLLDFGLAKTGATAAGATGLSMLPTTPPNLTAQGTILGTFQYMAPEQLEGKEADSRTDIFAFGAVLYEMVTGQRAFQGKSQASLIGSIMTAEPRPVSTIQPMTPPSLDFLIKRCLAKDPDERWQSAGDLLSQLEWIAEGGSQIGPSVATRQRRRTRESVAWILFGISTLFVSLLAGPAYRYWQGLQEADDVRFVVPTTAIPQAPHNALAISPDGRSIAFVAATTGDAMVLFVRPIGSLEAQQLPGTEGAGNPFWSPDSRQIAFTADGRLKKIDLAGGAPVTLCDMPGNNRAGTWNRDGVIVFAANAVLNRVSAAGGPSVPISTLDESRFEDHHTSPWFLPDGRHFLFSAWSADESNSALYVGALDSKETKLLLALSSKALYADPGYLLYQRQGTLFAHPFDAEDLAFTGDPIRLADDVGSGVPGVHSAFSVSGNGVLIYRTGVGRDEDFQLTWFDRSGRAVADLAPPGAYRGVDLSPDGTRVALHRHDGNGGDVWVLDASRPGALSRLTFDATQDNSMPIWSPDGNRIVFASTRNRRRGLYVKASDGSSNEELLVEGNSVNAMSWSPDSNFVLYSALSTATGADLWSVQLSGDRKPSPVVQGRADQLMGQISPDGKWLAYRSNETGRQEIYVQPFPAGAGRWQISASGGSFPRWRRDGRALYFVTVAGLMEAAIRPTESSFQSDVPRQLFVFTFIAPGHTGGVFHPYAVTADGQRFLVHRSISATATNNAPPPITVVVNWTAGLEK